PRPWTGSAAWSFRMPPSRWSLQTAAQPPLRRHRASRYAERSSILLSLRVSLRAQRSNLVPGAHSARDCFVALLLAMTALLGCCAAEAEHQLQILHGCARGALAEI